jgi:hypothetical protein
LRAGVADGDRIHLFQLLTMQTRALITRTAAFLAGMLGMLLLLEIVLRLLPVLGGTYAADPRESWPVHTMIPDSRFHLFDWMESREHSSRAHQQFRLRRAIRL